MRRRTTEALLDALLREVEGPERTSYLMLRGEPAPIVLVFEAGNESPRFVFKAARERRAREALEREQRVLDRLQANASEDLRETLPRLLAQSERDGTVVWLTTALAGARMKDLPPKQLFGPATVGPTLERITDWLASFHRASSRACAAEPPVDRRGLLEEPLAWYEAWFRPTDRERKLVRESLQALPDPGSEGFPISRSHGDFSTANLLWDRGRIGVIDFEFALEPCLPLQDLFYFLASLMSSTSPRDREQERRDYFEEVFYASGHLARAARQAILDLARALGVHIGLLEPLFVLAWVRFAVRSVELRLRELGLESLRDDTEALWSRLHAESGEFLPVARSGKGSCENVRQHLELRDRFLLARR
jgi:Ser/Thr protein kinase RdoA (MazF antagonist)